jgi:P4 family phage/plasmid primase-like protien
MSDINNPDDVADAGADLDAMVAAQAAAERKRSSRAQLKRAEIARRATDDMEFFQFSEGGNGDRFASRYVGRILMDDSGQRPVYYVVTEESNRWRRDTTGERTRWGREIITAMRQRAGQLLDNAQTQQEETAAKEFLKWARQSDTPTRINSMLRMACESWHMMVEPGADFDQRSDVICCADDTLIELRPDGIEVRKVRPEDMITKAASVRYNPGILLDPPQAVVEYQEMFMPDRERTRRVRKVIGQSLRGGNIHRLFVLMLGKSTTGKSQLMEAVQAALGDYAATGKQSVFRNNSDDKARPDILHVLARRIALFNEASEEWELHGDRVKDITGGGNVAVRQMYSGAVVEKAPEFTPFMLTNTLPTINGVDGGTKRRLMVIRWDHELPAGVVEDPNIKARFVADPAVREWCLAWAVQGYIDAAREGLEDCKAEFAIDTEAAFKELSGIFAFLEWAQAEGRLARIPDEELAIYGVKQRFVTLAQLFDLYVYWAKHYGNEHDRRRAKSERKFNSELREMHGWVMDRSGERRWQGWELVALRNLVAVDAAHWVGQN